MTVSTARPQESRRPVNRRRAAALIVSAIIPFACTRMSPIRTTPSVEADCQRFFSDLDAMTDAAGARDAGASGIIGAPYLRADRFLASFAREAGADAVYAAWLERLRAADADRREPEIANLGISRVGQGPSSPFPALSTREAVHECGRRLMARDLRSVERKKWLTRRVAVPDAYRAWRRVLGMYPLTRFGLEAGVAALHRELRATLATPLERMPQQGALLRYAPEPSAHWTADDAAQRLRRVRRDALGIPELGRDDLERLYASFAPVWEVDTVRRGDRIGSIRRGTSARPEVDVERPVVYRFVSYSRYQRETALQLNYLIWFPERSATGRLDLYAGLLDGVIWRVTLSAQGRPLAYDTIHACGCYYHLFPGIGYRVAQPEDGSEAVLSPYPLPPPKPGQRQVIRLSAGRHFVQAVYADVVENSSRTYRWREFRELLSLPAQGSRRRSLFGPDGLVTGTQRLERFLLWPSGIDGPGAMRQPGTHAIAMLGRRHFDDARLLETVLHPL